MLISVLIKMGASTVPRGLKLSKIFEEMHANGIRRIDDLPNAKNNILPYIAIRTRFARFWLAGNPHGLPDDPDAIRDLFGLGYLRKGDWLIRVSMPTVEVYRELGMNSKLVRRPTAFCVTDDGAPRFRGLTVDDHMRIPGSPVKTNGTTVQLNKVENDELPDNGEMEWACPEVASQQKNFHFDLLGKIKSDRPKPNNTDFAKYLRKTLPLSTDEEQKVIDFLAQP